MSGLEALSIACNIMQVISFARETIGFCKAVYEGQSLNTYSENSIESLAAISARLEAHYYGVTTPQTEQERELETIARKCNVTARALEDEVWFLTSHQAKGNLKQTLSVSLKTIWRKNRLKRLESSLRNHQHTMETYLLARVCTQSDAIKLRQREDFQKLSKDIRYFVSQYSAGCTNVTDLVQQEIVSTKSHVSNEVTTATGAISTHVTRKANDIHERMAQMEIRAESQSSTTERRNRLLESLRYPGMNERKNDSTDSHSGTFQWIFVHDGNNEEATLGDDEDDKPWDSFSDWLKSNSQIYWISGKPGSGKSTLMKFILESSSTISGLEIWKDKPVILSHFFWKPGSRMQNSLKGFICSILHQCLSSSTTMLDSTLITLELLLPKDSVTDWSIKELKEVCLAVLKAYPRPIFILLDGLDEICDPEGPRPILKLLDTFQLLPNLKVCVSSRPEPLLQSFLSRHQHLRLQDLTEDDMWEYAEAQLQPFIDTHQISQEFGRATATHTLVFKAEGVFLWLHLATRSLISGIENGDTEEYLQRRLADLPKELSDLYCDMWSRLNGDNRIYREAAALYFNLLISGQTLNEETYESPYSFSIFHIMATTQIQVQEAFIDKRSVMDAESLERLCDQTTHAIQVRCAGLLETFPNPSFALDQILLEEWEASYKPLLPRVTTAVRFIHRSAYDFVSGTEEGRRIRSHNTSDQGTMYIQLIKGEMICAKLFRHRLQKIILLLQQISMVADLGLPEPLYQLLRTAWIWYDDKRYHHGIGILCHDNGRPHFFAKAAFDSAFHTFILASIKENSNTAQLAMDILRDLDYSDAMKPGIPPDRQQMFINFVRDLIYLSKNVRLKGVCHGIAESQPVAFLSPAGSFIRQCFLYFELSYQSLCYLIELMHTFVDGDPDLDERIPLASGLDRHIAYWQSVGQPRGFFFF